MTYDFHDGKWNASVTAPQTNLMTTSYSQLSIDKTVKKLLGLGVPSTKIMIGTAFYSRGFSGTEGLGKPATGGSPDMSFEAGSVDYKDLPVVGSTEFFDVESQSAYSYDPVKKVLNTYDNPESVRAKCRYIKDNNLQGMLIWEVSADKPFSDPRSLSKVIAEGLLGGASSVQPPVVQPPVVQPPVVQPPVVQPPVVQPPVVQQPQPVGGGLTDSQLKNVIREEVRMLLQKMSFEGSVTGLMSFKNLRLN
jgi:chitinase